MKQIKIGFVDEQKIKINYPGVEKKNSRPYLIANLDNKRKALVPITGAINEDGIKKTKKDHWVKIKINKKSYVKFDEYYIFEKKFIKNAIKEEIIVFSNYSVPFWKRITINKLIKGIKNEQKEIKIINGSKPIYDAQKSKQSRAEVEEHEKKKKKIVKEIEEI